MAGAFVQLSSLSNEACAAASDSGLDLQEGQRDADIELLKTCRDEIERIPTDQEGFYLFSDVPPGSVRHVDPLGTDHGPSRATFDVPPAGFFFATLSAELLGDYRVDVSTHESTPGTYEIDVNARSVELRRSTDKRLQLVGAHSGRPEA